MTKRKDLSEPTLTAARKSVARSTLMLQARLYREAAERIAATGRSSAGYTIEGRAFNHWLNLFCDAPLLSAMRPKEAALAYDFVAAVLESGDE